MILTLLPWTFSMAWPTPSYLPGAYEQTIWISTIVQHEQFWKWFTITDLVTQTEHISSNTLSRKHNFIRKTMLTLLAVMESSNVHSTSHSACDLLNSVTFTSPEGTMPDFRAIVFCLCRKEKTEHALIQMSQIVTVIFLAQSCGKLSNIFSF